VPFWPAAYKVREGGILSCRPRLDGRKPLPHTYVHCINHLAAGNYADIVVPRLLAFWAMFTRQADKTGKHSLSVRDLLAWADFVNHVGRSMDPLLAYAHGAHLVILDGLGLGGGSSMEVLVQVRADCEAFLFSQLPVSLQTTLRSLATGLPAQHALTSDSMWGLEPFAIDRLTLPDTQVPFQFDAPATARNAMRVLRALQVNIVPAGYLETVLVPMKSDHSHAQVLKSLVIAPICSTSLRGSSWFSGFKCFIACNAAVSSLCSQWRHPIAAVAQTNSIRRESGGRKDQHRGCNSQDDRSAAGSHQP
jgi:hypothetical protein